MRCSAIGFTAALLLAPAACAARAVQAEPYAWELRGAVASVQGSTIEVRHKTGRMVVVTVDQHTVYMRDAAAASLQSVKPGGRVRVEIQSDDGVNRARQVRMFGAGDQRTQP